VRSKADAVLSKAGLLMAAEPIPDQRAVGQFLLTSLEPREHLGLPGKRLRPSASASWAGMILRQLRSSRAPTSNRGHGDIAVWPDTRDCCPDQYVVALLDLSLCHSLWPVPLIR